LKRIIDQYIFDEEKINEKFKDYIIYDFISFVNRITYSNTPRCNILSPPPTDIRVIEIQSVLDETNMQIRQQTTVTSRQYFAFNAIDPSFYITSVYSQPTHIFIKILIDITLQPHNKTFKLEVQANDYPIIQICLANKNSNITQSLFIKIPLPVYLYIYPHKSAFKKIFSELINLLS
jgi:hypothetical protein